MAVIDDYYFELEGRIEKAKSEEEIEILQREARKLYFPPEGGIGTFKPKYKGELQRYYIDKDRLLNDLKDIGISYHALAKSIGLKNVHIPKFKGEYCVTLLDKDRKNIMEFSGLDIMTYTKRTETAGRQPLRQVNADLIKEAIEAKGLKLYKVSQDIHGNSSALTNHLKRKEMPLHIAMELCDILGLEHEKVIIKEG